MAEGVGSRVLRVLIISVFIRKMSIQILSSFLEWVFVLLSFSSPHILKVYPLLDE